MDTIPPALRHRIRTLLAQLPRIPAVLEDRLADRLRQLVDREAAPWIGADPALAEVGHWMLDARHATLLRALGATWLARFPTDDTANRLAALVGDPATPPPVRDRALRALADRQLRDLHPSTLWSPIALQIADEALYKVADAQTAEGMLAGDELAHALRHVQSDVLGAVFARAPALWGAALECFATASLARVLFVSIDDIAPPHRLRVLRLIAHALGDEATPLLCARAASAAADERVEALLLAVAVGGEAQLGRLEDAIRAGVPRADLVRARAKWHLANRGITPTVRGLRIARVTATLPLAERASKCAQAADDLAILPRFARHSEPHVYTLWSWMVRTAGDPARAHALVVAHPEAQRLVRDLYLEDLARRGRVAQLVSTAQALGAEDHGALQLAIHGRPLAALELAAAARGHTPELVCARALACYRGGRPDLAARVLADDPPPAELGAAFPGPHERWLIAHAPRAVGVPVLAAVAKGLAAVAGLAQPAPTDAEPDLPSVAPIAAIARRLARVLDGATVYLCSDVTARDAVAAALAKRGARVVGGPAPGTDFYVASDPAVHESIALLARRGARRLLPAELGL
jgi:hypothetical protein